MLYHLYHVLVTFDKNIQGMLTLLLLDAKLSEIPTYETEAHPSIQTMHGNPARTITGMSPRITEKTVLFVFVSIMRACFYILHSTNAVTNQVTFILLYKMN